MKRHFHELIRCYEIKALSKEEGHIAKNVDLDRSRNLLKRGIYFRGVLSS